MVGGITYLIVNAVAGKTGAVIVLGVMGCGFYLLCYAVFTAMVGVAYHDLRTIKDGGSPQQLADVFA